MKPPKTISKNKIKFNSMDTFKLPRKGKSFIGWKKVYMHRTDAYEFDYTQTAILKLHIPASAERVFANSEDDINYQGKCRASKVFVIAAYSPEDGKRIAKSKIARLFSAYDLSDYFIGHWKIPDHYDPDNTEICSYGIHFYATKEQAETPLFNTSLTMVAVMV